VTFTLCSNIINRFGSSILSKKVKIVVPYCTGLKMSIIHKIKRFELFRKQLFKQKDLFQHVVLFKKNFDKTCNSVFADSVNAMNRTSEYGFNTHCIFIFILGDSAIVGRTPSFFYRSGSAICIIVVRSGTETSTVYKHRLYPKQRISAHTVQHCRVHFLSSKGGFIKDEYCS
jgi:hypothetical protein